MARGNNTVGKTARSRTAPALPAGVLDIWGGGQLLAFSGLDGATPYRQAIVCRTSFVGTGLLVKYPFEARLQFSPAKPRSVILTGDTLSVHHSAGHTRGAFVDACHLLLEGPCHVLACDPRLRIVADGSRTLIAPAEICQPARIRSDLDRIIRDRNRWIVAVAKPNLPGALRRKTFWKCLSVIKTCVYSPEGRLRHRYTTPDRWPHRGMWLWDSAFNAIGIRHVDPGLARDAVEAVLDGQCSDGQVQISYFHTGKRSPHTQPPTLAMAAQLIHRSQPRRDWIRRIYPRLAAYLEWDMANRDCDGAGLVEWAIEPSRRCRCGESGWDNSPRFDPAVPLDAVDFNAFLAYECEAMAGFAGELGRSRDRTRWLNHHARLCRLINARLWDEKMGFYVDCLASNGERQPLYTAAGFLPLLCGAPSPAQARVLVRRLRDPKLFATPVPVPSMPSYHREHYSKDMWRGPVWININWCIIRGLQRYGFRADARWLRAKTLAVIEKYYREYGAIFEFFDDEDKVAPPDLLRKQKNDPAQWIHQVVHDYTWTATLYMDLVLEARRGG